MSHSTIRLPKRATLHQAEDVRWLPSSAADQAWLSRFRLERHWAHRFGASRRLDASIASKSVIPAAELPRRIWIYWKQGWSNAPALVDQCRRSWIEKNPDWEVVELDETNLGEWIDNASIFEHREMSVTHRSNLVRLHLLARHGGVWTDATVWCSSPLSAWLPDLLANGFFAFSRPGPDRLLATWFLVAQPAHPLVQAWQERVERYWRLVDKADFPYWFHHLFARMIRERRDMRRLWRISERVSAVPSLVSQFTAVGEPIPPVGPCRALEPPPVHKLNWRFAMPGEFAEKPE